ncbi:MAG TPA: sensor histidine kinase [Streptosporangiales bacterium]
MLVRGRRLRRGVTNVVVALVVALLACGPYLAGRFGPGLHARPDRFEHRLALPLWTVAFPVAAALALLFRERWPRATLGWTVAVGAVATVVGGGDSGAAFLPIMVALYTLTLHSDRGTWLAAAGGTALVMVVTTVVPQPAVWERAIGVPIWVALAPAVAQAVRNRRAYLAEAAERAHRAEQTKEIEARRRVAEERIRIARDLHDVLAHTIAVVNVQSAVAAHVIDDDVAQAKQALQHINDASDTALTELRATLEVLRQDGDPRAPAAPAPGLGDVDGLLDGVRAAGVVVRRELPTDLDGVSPEVGLVAYRVLQEALTNVLKHAQADTVEVAVGIDGGRLELCVRDDGVGAPDPPEYGHGRIGMRERVHALGGSIADGPAAPGYLVRATIPLRQAGR